MNKYDINYSEEIISDIIEKVAKLLEINDLVVEGSDSLDNPDAVFN